ncbi:MAG: hypothetical protein JRJ75_10105 [Deltaproteobacteria bacterium]|nr:hypothetical protein [Deltaproteobacteria bacterium]
MIGERERIGVQERTDVRCKTPPMKVRRGDIVQIEGVARSEDQALSAEADLIEEVAKIDAGT